MNIEYNQGHSNLIEDQKETPKFSSFASLPWAMINPQWLELPISRTKFHGHKGVRAIEVWLYEQVQ